MDIILCSSNINLDTLVLSMNKNFPNYNIIFSDCLHCCGECSRYPIAKVDGRVLVGEDIDDLTYKIKFVLEKFNS
ncbi:YuzB family protein [Clostridium omnivorum]|uniref:DUF1450 domain-containing protein n=1 Tax=Clostridium omnivorum TaxID=1604902 RepID=A0ABQ5NAS4_9CLOT|nr:YuzB family protein [Clostridium sp. E14]GLC32296.1 hypothetical protein bsdE14_37060 [Clostridium sp. E14]